MEIFHKTGGLNLQTTKTLNYLCQRNNHYGLEGLMPKRIFWKKKNALKYEMEPIKTPLSKGH